VQPLTNTNNTPSLRNLFLNSGTLDLFGRNQAFGALFGNANPTYGSDRGTITNTAGHSVNIASHTGGERTPIFLISIVICEFRFRR